MCQMAVQLKSHLCCPGEGAGKSLLATVTFELFLMDRQEFARGGRAF